VIAVVEPVNPPVPMLIVLVLPVLVEPVEKFIVLLAADAVNKFALTVPANPLAKLSVAALLPIVKELAEPHMAIVPIGVANALVNPLVPSMLVSPARLVEVEPNETAVLPNVTELLASIAFDTEPVSPVPTSVPVVIGKDKVGVPAVAVACTVAVPLVLPGNATELIPVNARLAVARLIATLVVPINIV